MLIIQTRSGMKRIEFRGDRTKDSVSALERAALQHGYVLHRAVEPDRRP